MRHAAFLFLMLCPWVAEAAECPKAFQQTLKRLHSSEQVNLCDLVAGKPVLVVNTASKCGYTRQFKGLEALHQRYKARGLVVIGFPSDDFWQEVDDEAETARICQLNYGVTFTMVAPVSVRGDDANPLFADLARQSDSPAWNFNKYVIDSTGKVVKHFGASTEPESPVLSEAIERAL